MYVCAVRETRREDSTSGGGPVVNTFFLYLTSLCGNNSVKASLVNLLHATRLGREARPRRCRWHRSAGAADGQAGEGDTQAVRDGHDGVLASQVIGLRELSPFAAAVVVNEAALAGTKGLSMLAREFGWRISQCLFHSAYFIDIGERLDHSHSCQVSSARVGGQR